MTFFTATWGSWISKHLKPDPETIHNLITSCWPLWAVINRIPFLHSRIMTYVYLCKYWCLFPPIYSFFSNLSCPFLSTHSLPLLSSPSHTLSLPLPSSPSHSLSLFSLFPYLHFPLTLSHFSLFPYLHLALTLSFLSSLTFTPSHTLSCL